MDSAPEHLDVLIVGAGLSGVGAAYHLQASCPQKTYAILEGRDRMGGTWDLFRYPGIRSDSDMYTLGYSFRPWKDAEGDRRRPLDPRVHPRDRRRGYGIDRRIRYDHRVERADACVERGARWTVEARDAATGETVAAQLRLSLRLRRLLRLRGGLHAGVRRARALPRPRRPPAEVDADDIDYAGKRVVVIGSGATAVTLVPELAKRAAHVTMLQRSPTYIVSLPARDAIADCVARACSRRSGLRARALEERAARQWRIYQLLPAASRAREGAARRRGLERQIADGSTSRRISRRATTRGTSASASCPTAICSRRSAPAARRSSPTTSRRSPRPASGCGPARELEADLVVTATGLKLQAPRRHAARRRRPRASSPARR